MSKFLDIMSGGVGGAVAGTAMDLAGRIGQKKREERQVGYQKDLMKQQMENQKALNIQGQQLAMKTWLDTNAQAQVEQYEKAGLNPALMYGGSGAGGTTAAGSGGGASGGTAPQVQHPSMDIGNAIQGMLAISQKKNIDADTEQKRADANKTAGVDTELASGQIALLAEQAKSETVKRMLVRSQEAAQSLENTINWATKEDKIGEIKAEAREAAFNMRIAATESQFVAESYEARMNELKASSIGAVIANQAARVGIEVDQARIREIENGILQKWQTVGQGWKGLSQKDKEVKVKEFEADLKAEYPGVQQVIGNSLQSVLDLIGILDQKMYGTAPRLRRK